MTQNPEYLTSKELADRFRIAENTVASWRMRKVGVPYVKMQGKVRYKLEDVVKYEKENMKNVGVEIVN